VPNDRLLPMTDSTTWDAVMGFFAGRSIPVQEVPAESDLEHVLRVDGSGDNGDWVLWAYLRPEQFTVWCTWPDAIPSAAVDGVAEWVALANPAMSYGSFEIDPEDSVLSLRRSTDVIDGRLDPATVAAMVEWAIETFDDALAAVVPLARAAEE
jgi:hypothetical protein